MALSRILSLALIQVILLSGTATATGTTIAEPTTPPAPIANTISILFSKPPAVSSIDDYLLPLFIGSNSQLVYLTPSTNSDDTFVNTPQTCTPPGNSSMASESCIQYRGGVFGPPQSSSWKPTKDGKFKWDGSQFGLFADGDQGQDTIVLSETGRNITIKKFGLGVVDDCNMTSAFLGLGKDSTLLTQLVAAGVINSRSYGLHVGVDIVNHPSPIWDPTFDDTAEKDVVGGVHQFPGELILGGYDQAKIDNRTAGLQAPITSDGNLEVEMTNMVVRNRLAGGTRTMAYDVLNITRKVIIDSSTPYMYLPETTAQQLSFALDAQYGKPGVDFLYGTADDQDLGNVTITLQILGGGGSIDIVIPPSVLYQPVTTLTNYVPVSSASHFLPIKAFADDSDQPIILGRTFLKAAYLFVNYDNSTFDVSQVRYTKNPPSIVGIAADSDGVVLDTATGTTIIDNASGSDSDGIPPPHGNGHPPIAPIAAAVGVGAVMGAFAILFLVWRRRQSDTQANLAPIPSSVTLTHYGNELDTSGTQMMNLPPRDRDQKHPGGPSAETDWGVWEKNGSGGYYTPHPLAASGGQHYEMESDFVGTTASPTQVYPPRWAELPAHMPPAHMQHPAYASQPGPYGQQEYPPGHQGQVPELRYEMM